MDVLLFNQFPLMNIEVAASIVVSQTMPRSNCVHSSFCTDASLSAEYIPARGTARPVDNLAFLTWTNKAKPPSSDRGQQIVIHRPIQPMKQSVFAFAKSFGFFY